MRIPVPGVRAEHARHWRAHRDLRALRKRDCRRPELAQAFRRELLDRHALDEIVQRQAAVGARKAVRRQHVVGAAAIVAHRFRRPGAEEDRTGVANLRQPVACARVTCRIRCSGAYALLISSAVSSVSTTNSRACSIDLRSVSMRPRPCICLSICIATASASAEDVVTSTACASVLCSACASRSAATNSARAVASAITSTSDGPAGRSSAAPSGSVATSSLAAVTHALPGPKILSTFGTVCVPYAIAAIACAPPTLNTRRTPQRLAMVSTAGSAVPSRRGGVQMMRVGQPAMRAGTASMIAAEGRGATPAGT